MRNDSLVTVPVYKGVIPFLSLFVEGMGDFWSLEGVYLDAMTLCAGALRIDYVFVH